MQKGAQSAAHGVPSYVFSFVGHPLAPAKTKHQFSDMHLHRMQSGWIHKVSTPRAINLLCSQLDTYSVLNSHMSLAILSPVSEIGASCVYFGL